MNSVVSIIEAARSLIRPTVLRKAGFLLRPLKLSDVRDFVRMFSDRREFSWLWREIPEGIGDGLVILGKEAVDRVLGVSRLFAVDVNGEMAGVIGFRKVSREDHAAELVAYLNKEYRRRGIATAAMDELVRFGFSQLGLNRIYFYVDPGNALVVSRLEKLAPLVVQEGRLRQNERIRGRFVDDLVYSILREDWVRISKERVTIPAGMGSVGVSPADIGRRDSAPPEKKIVLFKKLILEEFLGAVRRVFPDISIQEENKISATYSREKEHGEYSIAVFPLAKALRQKPQAIAQAIMSELEKGLLGSYFEVSTVGPYINLKFLPSFLLRETPNINAEFGKNDALAGLTALVEWVSANPTGPLHIGHGRWAVLGDSICRLLTACGAKVTREFYVNDAGAQIQRFRDSVQAARESRPIPEDGYHGAYVNELAKSAADPVASMIESHRQTLASAGVNFDVWFSEKSLHEQNKVKEAIELLERMGLTYRAKVRAQDAEEEPNADKDAAEGEALWFKSTQFGDTEDRVLVRADGRPTYFAADVAYHLNKIQRGFGLLINIFGADHHGYVARLSAAIQALSGGKQQHQIIIGQLVKLLRGGEEVRMSKRTGEMITLNDLLDELGPDAVRIFMSLTGFNTALNIDLDVAKSQSEENPYYYLEYAHARISQILRKAEEAGLSPAVEIKTDYALLAEEREMLAQLFKYPDMIHDAASARDVSQIVKYAVNLAAVFSAYYTRGQRENLKVMDKENPEITGIRLAMVKGVQQVLKNAFEILGITPLDRLERET